MAQLREEADRRGWTASSALPSSAARAEPALELPSGLREVLADAPPEQAGAFERLSKALGTQRAGTLSNIAVVVVTLVAIAATLADDGATRTNTASGDVEVHTGDVQGTVDVVNVTSVDVTSDVLDAIGDDTDARAELLQRLRTIDDSESDEPAVPATEQAPTGCGPSDGDAPP